MKSNGRYKIVNSYDDNNSNRTSILLLQATLNKVLDYNQQQEIRSFDKTGNNVYSLLML